jgi:hypothetical protein
VPATGNLCGAGGGQPRTNANSSNNWFGYNQGTLERGGRQFNSIAGDWTVPTATQHASGDEASSDWIGIGGGCVDANCTVGDSTLIQTGTEQDVSSGSASYGAWWELIPGPSIAISNMTCGWATTCMPTSPRSSRAPTCGPSRCRT